MNRQALRGAWVIATVVLCAHVSARAADAVLEIASSGPAGLEADATALLDRHVPADPGRTHAALEEIAAGLSAPQPGAWPEQLGASEERLLKQGDELRQDGDLRGATTRLERLLRIHPTDRRVLRCAALAAWQSGEAAEAQRLALSSLDNVSDDVVMQYVLGRLAANRFENAEAIRRFWLAVNSPENHSHRRWRQLARFHLAETLFAEGYLDAAEQVYAPLLAELIRDDSLTETTAGAAPDALTPGESDWPKEEMRAAVAENLARARDTLGSPTEAVEAITAGFADIQAMPRKTRLCFAGYLLRAGRTDDAASIVKDVVAEDSRYAPLLGRIYAGSDQPDAYLGKLAELHEQNPSSDELTLSYARALIGNGQAARAAILLEERSTNAASELFFRDGAKLLASTGDLGAATDLALRAVNRNAEWAESIGSQIRGIFGDAEAETAQRIAGRLMEELSGFDSSQDRKTAAAKAFVAGQAALALKEPAVARRLFQFAVDANAELLAARLDLARLLIERFDWPGALAVLAPDGVVLPEDARIEYLLGHVRRGLDQWQLARIHYQMAVHLDPTNVDAQMALAGYYAMLSDQEKAAEAYRRVIELAPQNVPARERLFHALIQMNEKDKALVVLAELKQMDASPLVVARCNAVLALNQDEPDYEGFRRTLREGMEAAAPDAETLALIAMSFEREKRWDDMILVLNQALEFDETHATSIALMVEALRAKLDFEQALDWQRRLVAMHPNRLAWFEAENELMLILQQYDELAGRLESLVDATEPTDEQALDYRQQLLEVYFLQENNQKAVTMLEQLREQDVSGLNLLPLARLYALVGRQDDAVALLNELYRTPSALFEGNYERVWAELDQESLQALTPSVLGLVERYPDFSAVQRHVISFLRARHEYDQAAELARGNIAEGQDKFVFTSELCRTLQAAGRLEEAFSVAGEILEDPGLQEDSASLTGIAARFEWADIALRLGRTDLLADRLRGWSENAVSEEDRQIYLRQLAYVLDEAGRPDEAIETLEGLLRIDPEDAGANNDLGYMLANLGRDVERAEKMVRQAVSQEPRTGPYLDSLGWVLYKKGAFQEAVVWLVRATRTADGVDPVVLDHLADAYWRQGKRQEAEAAWRESLKLGAERAKEVGRASDVAVVETVRAKLAALEAGKTPEIAPTAAEQEPAAGRQADEETKGPISGQDG